MIRVAANTHYLGIVTRNSSKGYEVVKHVKDADTLVKAELYSGEVTYHRLDLPKEQESMPGQKLVDHINQYHPDLNTLVTGDETLKDKRLEEKGIAYESYESGKYAKEAIDHFKKKYDLEHQKAA